MISESEAKILSHVTVNNLTCDKIVSIYILVYNFDI